MLGYGNNSVSDLFEYNKVKRANRFDGVIYITRMCQADKCHFKDKFGVERAAQNLPSIFTITPHIDNFTKLANVTIHARKATKYNDWDHPWVNQSLQESFGLASMFVLDIDSDKSIYYGDLIKLCNQVQSFLERYINKKLQLPSPYKEDKVKHLSGTGWISIQNSNKKDKYHVYFPEAILKEEHIKQVYKYLHDNLSNLIDTPKGLRLPWQQKPKDPESVYKITDNCLHDLTYYHLTRNTKQAFTPIYDNINNIKIISFEMKVGFEDMVKRWDKIAKMYPQYIKSTEQNNPTGVLLNRVHPSTCRLRPDGHKHTSVGAVFYGEYLHCFSCKEGFRCYSGEDDFSDFDEDEYEEMLGEKKEPKKLTKEEEIALVDENIREIIKDQPKLALYGELIDVDEDYVDFANHIEDNDTIIMQSAMGTGKTSNLLKAIQRMKVPPKSVLFVCTRINGVNDIINKFQFPKFKLRSYQEEGDLMKISHICTTVESLHRMNYIDGYDMVIIDESTSVFNQFGAPHHKMGSKSRNVMLEILSKAEKVIYMDANIDMRTLLVNQNTRSSRLNKLLKTVIIDNEYKPEKEYVRYSDKNTMENLLLESLVKGETCVVSSATVSVLDSVKAKLNVFGIDVTTKIYSASHDYDKTDLEDVEESWKDTQLIMYSPTVSQGVSYTGKVDKVFVYTHYKSVSFRESFQQANRCRNVGSFHIYVGGAYKVGKQMDMKTITKNYVNEQYTIQNNLNRLQAAGVDVTNAINSTVTTDSLEFKLFALNELESINNTRNHHCNVMAYMYINGYMLIDIDTTKAKGDKDTKKAISKAKSVILNTRKSEFASKDISHLAHCSKEDIQRKHVTGKEDKNTLIKANLALDVDNEIFNNSELTHASRVSRSLLGKMKEYDLPKEELLELAIKDSVKRKKCDRYHTRSYLIKMLMNMCNVTVISDFDGAIIKPTFITKLTTALVAYEKDKKNIRFNQGFDLKLDTKHEATMFSINKKPYDKRGLSWFFNQTLGSSHELYAEIVDKNIKIKWRARDVHKSIKMVDVTDSFQETVTKIKTSREVTLDKETPEEKFRKSRNITLK